MIVALLASALLLFGGQSPIQPQPQPHPSCKRAHHHCQAKWDHGPYTYTTRWPTSDGGTVIARCRVNPRTGVTSCSIIGYIPPPPVAEVPGHAGLPLPRLWRPRPEAWKVRRL
jgi:hypothetical protein